MKTNINRFSSLLALLSLLALAGIQAPAQPASAAEATATAQRVVVFEGFYRPT